MTFANIIKILLLIATVLQVIAGLNGILSPEISAILAGIASAIFAFTSKVGSPEPKPTE